MPFSAQSLYTLSESRDYRVHEEKIMAKMADRVTALMKFPEQIRNIAICAHIDHGKTTFSDNLLAGAGMMSEELAGKAL